ncbi:50S ribosomal protein L7/L12 [Candidatus Uhrbacteria bacterium CG10_big_fil_rev_8_21_14_0_10_48_11]|uniref:Large ribosomal subunit protein bL12 n=1 Tax=Candidatus Uhrbacteria bacterium CG10_big_fil_rev_8_21_14_0_10_48_11 TaxID=1975037 RepID=A0A2M8LDE9_9BACT|nr:MAG: 50S ribosomal protein L7/L12 [Candidatus Uhrbacteria bacterium CG10_big_fil_rev_8_21_14_0_10_48_11]
MAEEAQQEEKNQDAAEVEVPAKFKAIVDTVSAMSVVDLAELVKVLEEKFGVSAAAPMAMMGAAAPAAGAAGAEEEASAVVNIELTEAGGNKIAVIKVVREITEKGLKDAKDMVDGAPQVVKEGVERAEAEAIKKKLEEAGAKVTFK